MTRIRLAHLPLIPLYAGVLALYVAAVVFAAYVALLHQVLHQMTQRVKRLWPLHPAPDGRATGT